MPKPAGWKPPYAAYWPQFGDDATVVLAYFGLQNAASRQRERFHAWITDAFAAARGPGFWERGYFTDGAGLRNDLYVGYWRDAGEYRAWRRGRAVAEFWDSPQRLNEGAGYWNESLILPNAFFEALFSSTEMAGVAKLARQVGEPVDEHAYWGAARDRIAVLGPGLQPEAHSNVLPPSRAIPSSGRRLLVQAPEQLCLIHSGQNWSQCRPEQMKFYLEEVQPTLEQGLGFLATNAPETGCAVSRYVRELNAEGGEEQRTYALCYFLTFKHLEDWAREHPTHLRIFGSFMRLAQTFDFDVQLKLWHQVAVLPPGNPPFEYLNCHPQTGLVPYYG